MRLSDRLAPDVVVPSRIVRGRGNQAGFTLVELLVVVTIIVILLALLTPALDKSIAMAERTLCATNLHAFATGSSQYGFDNRRKIHTIPRHYKEAGQGAGDGLAYPWYIWLYAETFPGEFNMEAIRPYIGETQPASPAQATMGKLWLCPSSQMADIRRNNEVAYVKQPRGPVVAARDEGPGIWGEYAWFGGGGGGGVPAKYATNRSRLNKGTLGGKGIIMGDNIFRHSSGPAWYYNHGSYMRSPTLPWGIEGMNAAWGDGSAAWDEWDDTRRKAALGLGPKNEMGDYVSAIGAAAAAPSNGDLFTFY